MSIGGVPCLRWELITNFQISCYGTESSSWQSRAVRVELISGQVVTADVFRYYGQPRITTVDPGRDTVLGGTVQTVACTGCGESLEDVVEMKVGASRCQSLRLDPGVNFTVGEPLRIECTAPAGVGRQVPVSVLTRGGL